MSESSWRVLDGEGNEQGPYSFQDLQSYYTTGNIDHDTMIWTEGLDEWVPAGRVEGLLPDIPQVVELAPPPLAAAVAPVQVAPVGGINLSPQISGVSPYGVGEAKKNGAPTWISIFTILSGVVALALYFFPWVSISEDISLTAEKKMVKIVTQSGVQSITQDVKMTDDMVEAFAKTMGMKEEAVRKEFEEAEKESKKAKDSGEESEENFDKSVLNMVALIAVGLGLVLALIGFLNQGRSLILFTQILFVVGAICIGSQMAKQFPMIAEYIEAQEETQEGFEEMIKAQEEMAKAVTSMGDSAAELGSDETKAEVEKEAAKADAEMKASIAEAGEKIFGRYKTAFEPSCFITVGLLACSLLLLVVTLSSGDSTTILIPQPGSQPLSPQQPHQPGSSIRFQ